MNAVWDARQREWLQALGYEVLVPIAGDAAVPDPGGAAASEATGPAARPAPAADGLLDSIARAARCDGAGVIALGLDLARLRADPAAKRALWPRLRALRRGRR